MSGVTKMNASPVVSVVIAVYNASRWIGETLDSVLAQDFVDFEIIVVDDGSTDDSAAVIARYGERVRYIYKSNGGPSSARNIGIRASQSEYIAFVDADDLWVKEKLTLQVERLRRTGLAWVYCDAVVFEGEGGKRLHKMGLINRQYEGDILESLILANYIPSPTPIIRRTVFDHVGYFDEDMKFGEDWNMWLMIAAQYPIGLLSQPLAYYRQHAKSVTGKLDTLTILQRRLTVVETATAREPARLYPLKGRAIANSYVAAGLEMIKNGDLADARMVLAKATQYYPKLLFAYLLWLSTLLGNTLLKSLMKVIRLRLRQDVMPPETKSISKSL